MKKTRLIPVLLLALVLVAVAAYATGPTLSLSSIDLGRTLYMLTANVSGGTSPYTYEWSVDGGAWTEGGQSKIIYCMTHDSLSGRVIDDNQLVSNVETFNCP